MFLCFFLSWVLVMKKIANKKLQQVWLEHSISQLIKPTQNVILKKMGLSFCDASERSVEGPSCQFSYIPGGSGFSEKTLILKETIFSSGKVKAFASYSSKQNSINCRGCSTALSISPEHYAHILHLWTSSLTAEANGNLKPGQIGHVAEAGDQNQMDLSSRETLVFTG